MNTERYFPSLKITESTMTDQQVMDTMTFALGTVIERIETRGDTRIIHINQKNKLHLYEWDDFYEVIDEYGCVYIDRTADESHGMTYSRTKTTNTWEVCYAKKTRPRISTTSSNPRYRPHEIEERLWNNETKKWMVVTFPRIIPAKKPKADKKPDTLVKLCTCGCLDKAF